MYHGRLIPKLITVQDDLDDESDAIAIIDDYLPKEFAVFLEVYKEFPSPKIKIYTPVSMKQILDMQFALTREFLIENKLVKKLVHIHPLCYSKHYKNNMNDTQYINVLCYVNILGESEQVERFFVMILELDDLQDKKAHMTMLIEKINVITTKVSSNIEYLEDLDLQTFIKAFKIVFKQQSFNM